MKTIDRYIAREVLGAWLIGVGWFASIWFALVALNSLTRLATREAVTSFQMTQLLLLEVPRSVALTLPMGMLYGALMAFARFSNDGEMHAMLTSGISFYRLMPSVLALGAVGSLLTFALNEGVVPPTQRARDRIVDEIRGELQAQARRWVWLREPADMSRPPQRILSAKRYIEHDNVFIRPDVTEYRNGVPERMISADKGQPLKGEQEDRWIFINARIVQFLERETIVSRAERCEVRLGKTPQQMRTAVRPVDPDQMNWRELWDYYDALRRNPDASQRELNERLVQLHGKASLPLACLVMCLLGPPLALRRQRTSASLGFGLSFLIIVGYFLVWNVATMLGKTGGMNPALSSWLANIVSTLVGAVLVWRAGR